MDNAINKVRALVIGAWAEECYNPGSPQLQADGMIWYRGSGQQFRIRDGFGNVLSGWHYEQDKAWAEAYARLTTNPASCVADCNDTAPTPARPSIEGCERDMDKLATGAINVLPSDHC